MQQKQLANVLIKILGLYFGVDGLVRIVSGVLNMLAVLTAAVASGHSIPGSVPFAGMIMAAIGMLFILLEPAHCRHFIQG